MKTRILIILFFFISIFKTFGQVTCGSIFDPATVQVNDAARYNRYLLMEQQTSNYIGSLTGGNHY
ncbi:MAG: hypothetical protein K2Q21_12960 [Chitinophagaceae bacterium]|nr:hypothetical protein [Chitinophagaceae bacterium]